MLAEIGDIRRFGNARKFASWSGLTPTVRGSDLTVRHGHISKQGSAWLRWILIEAAQTAKRHPDFAPAYVAMSRDSCHARYLAQLGGQIPPSTVKDLV